MTLAKAAHGAIGLAKASAQVVGIPIDEADALTRQRRRDTCRMCDQSTGRGVTWFCRECNCWLLAKTRIKSEPCCKDKWK